MEILANKNQYTAQEVEDAIQELISQDKVAGSISLVDQDATVTVRDQTGKNVCSH